MYREQGLGGFFGSVVRCEGCGAKATWKQMSYTTACDHEAAEAWNRRAKDEADIRDKGECREQGFCECG